MNRLVVYSILLCLLVGCGGSDRVLSAERQTARGSEALSAAVWLLENEPYRNIDCSAFVRACYHSAEMKAYLRRQPSGRSMARGLFRFCTDRWIRRARFADIQPGDLVFFNKTYDANRDGAINGGDRWTHVGIAESFSEGKLVYLDASKGRKGPRIRRRSFSILPKGKNENVARDPATGARITHKDTFDSAFGME